MLLVRVGFGSSVIFHVFGVLFFFLFSLADVFRDHYFEWLRFLHPEHNEVSVIGDGLVFSPQKEPHSVSVGV